MLLGHQIGQLAHASAVEHRERLQVVAARKEDKRARGGRPPAGGGERRRVALERRVAARQVHEAARRRMAMAAVVAAAAAAAWAAAAAAAGVLRGRGTSSSSTRGRRRAAASSSSATGAPVAAVSTTAASAAPHLHERAQQRGVEAAARRVDDGDVGAAEPALRVVAGRRDVEAHARGRVARQRGARGLERRPVWFQTEGVDGGERLSPCLRVPPARALAGKACLAVPLIGADKCPPAPARARPAKLNSNSALKKALSPALGVDLDADDLGRAPCRRERKADRAAAGVELGDAAAARHRLGDRRERRLHRAKVGLCARGEGGCEVEG